MSNKLRLTFPSSFFYLPSFYITLSFLPPFLQLRRAQRGFGLQEVCCLECYLSFIGNGREGGRERGREGGTVIAVFLLTFLLLLDAPPSLVPGQRGREGGGGHTPCV